MLPDANKPGKQSESPEKLYRTEQDPRERRRLQGEVVKAYGPHLDRLVRRMCRDAQHRADLRQAGVEAILSALERFDPDRGVQFWTFAYLLAVDAIRKCMGQTVYWRQQTNRGADAQRRAAFEAAKQHRTCSELRDDLADRSPSPEDTAVANDAMERLVQALNTLSEKDRRVVLSRHHNSLVARLRAYVEGDDDDGDGNK